MMDAPEFQRWFNQAVHTYNSTKKDYEDADYGWACFKCQQAAECALKALLRGAGKLGIDSLLKLTQDIETLGIDVDEIRKCSLALEKFYIPTRYPDAYPEGSPYEFYDAEEAEKALVYCQTIIEFVKGSIMRNLIQLRTKERENLLEKAEKYLEIMRERLGRLSGIVFGSVPKGYTRSEFEKLKQKGNPFIQLILEEGIVLTDELGIFGGEQ